MKKSFFIMVICAFFITSCSPRLVGTWNVDQYSIDNQQGNSMNTRNAGEIILRKNGTGTKDIQYNMFHNQLSDIQEFRWNKPEENLITITSTNSNQNSDFDKTWIIVTDKKNRQVWRATDGSNTVQTLQLSKK